MTPISDLERPAKSRRPLLVATLGPTSVGLEASLAEAGVDQFRLNASHLTPDALRESVFSAYRGAPGVPIVVDLQGAKMRLGNFDPFTVTPGTLLRFVLQEAASNQNQTIPLPHPEVYPSLRSGDRVSIDDGRLTGIVESVELEHLDLRMQNGGVLKPRKGFNRAVHPIELDALSERDTQLAEVAHECGCRSFAVSFVADGRECDWVRRLLKDVTVIAKIERHEALENLDAIAQRSDALWICRGDLGVQLGLSRLGRAVADIDPARYRGRVFMAGQVLEHLTAHRDPTRSEICHLHDLARRGYAGVVLSDETAIGCDPVNATRLARSFLDAASD